MRNYFMLSLATFLMLMLTSCTVIEGIFKAGMYWAYLLIALVVGGIIFLFTRGKK